MNEHIISWDTFQRTLDERREMWEKNQELRDRLDLAIALLLDSKYKFADPEGEQFWRETLQNLIN